MGFFDEKMKLAEAQTEKLIADYALALRSHQQTPSVKAMAASGAPQSSIVDRAATIHTGLFKALIANSDARQVLKSPRRVRIIEQFCLALWANVVGAGAYEALVGKFKPAPKP